MGGEGTKEKILKLLSRHDYGLTIEEIARSLEINRMTASKYLAILEATKKIVVREVGKAKLHYSKERNGQKWLKLNNIKSSCGLNSISFLFLLFLFFTAIIFFSTITTANPNGGNQNFEISVIKDYTNKLITLDIQGPPLTDFSLTMINPENKSISPKDNVPFRTDQEGRYELNLIGFVPGDYFVKLVSNGTEYTEEFEIDPFVESECNRSFLEYRAENATNVTETNESVAGDYVWDICRDFVESSVTEELISEVVENRTFVEEELDVTEITEDSTFVEGENATNETIERTFVEEELNVTEIAENRTFLENESDVNETVINETLERSFLEEELNITEIAENRTFVDIKDLESMLGAKIEVLLVGDKIHLELSGDGYKLKLREPKDLSQLKEVKFVRREELKGRKLSTTNKRIVTDILYVNSEVEVETADILIPKHSRVSKIVSCQNFNPDMQSCDGEWVEEPISFQQNSTHVWFTVTHFTGYGGIPADEYYYVTGTDDYPNNKTGVLEDLSTSRDDSANYIDTGGNLEDRLYTLLNASITNIKGRTISTTDTITFRGYWTLGSSITTADATYRLWRNQSGTLTLICKIGDDSTGGPDISDATLVFGSCSPSSDVTLSTGDGLMFQVNVYVITGGNPTNKWVRLSWDTSTFDTGTNFTATTKTDINVTANQSDYTVNDVVNASGYYFWDNGTMIDNKNVTVKIYNTSNDLKDEKNVTTGSSGLYWRNYTIPSGEGNGTWTVNVTGIFNDTINATDSTTFELILYGSLNVNLTSPPDYTAVTQNTTFYLNVTISCEGATDAICGTVYANAMYNESSANPDKMINTTDGATPFYFLGTGTGEIVNFTDGFSPASDAVMGLGYDPTDDTLWLTDTATDYAYHYNKSGSDLGDGYDLGADGLDWPTGVVYDSSDDSYWVADQGATLDEGYIYHYDSEWGDLGDDIDTGAAGAGAVEGIAYDPTDDTLWAVDLLDKLVYHFNASTGANITDGFALLAGMDWASGMAYDPTDDTLWITDGGSDYMYHLDKDGTNLTDGINVLTLVGSALPEAIGFDTTDNSFWVPDDTALFVYHFGPEGAPAENPQSQTLIKGQTLSANWTVNATGTNNTQYKITVKANSSESKILTNYTNNITVCIGDVCEAPAGDTSPTASLGTNPVVYLNDSDGSLTFDLKCSDDNGVSSLKLYGNWSGWHANETNSSPGNDAWWNVTVSGIPEGMWKWDAWCNDTIGQEDWSDVNRTFTVDLTNPTASMGTNPIDYINDSDGTITFDLKCTDNFIVDTLQLYGNWTGSWVANQTNSSPTDNGFWNITASDIPEGTWKWGVYCNDTSNRGDWSASNRTLTIDLTDPQIGGKYINESGSVDTDTIVCLNVSGISDTHLETVWTTVNQSNGSVFNITMSDTGSCAGSPGDNWYSADVNVGDSTGTFFYNTTYVNDSSGRVNSNTTVLNLGVGIAGGISNCTNITSSGTYLLTQDIPDSAFTYCINISTSNVTLDCQGFDIQGQDTGSTYGIYADSSSGSEYQNITIENCNVTDWGDGVYWDNVDDSEITNITANSNVDDGLEISYSDNNNLTNITTNSNPDNGLYLSRSDNNIITNITTNSNYYGVYLYYSQYNQLTDMTLLNNVRFDLFVTGSCSNLFTSVTGTDNKPIVYYNYSVTIEDWNNNVSQIVLCDADNSVIDNVTLDHASTENNGILLMYTDSTNITNTQVYDLYYGLYISYSDNNNLTNITTNSNYYGLYLGYSYNNTLTNITTNSNSQRGLWLSFSDENNLTNITTNSNTYGFYVWYSDENNLTSITANSNTQYGLYLYGSSSNNTLTNSRIENNNQYGIYLYSSGQTDPNKIYNNLFNNTDNIDFSGTVRKNEWNTTNQSGTRVYSDGLYIGGNYWTDPDGNFSDNCDDDDSDGFCDDAYNITNGAPCTPGVNCSVNATDYLAYSDRYDATPPTVRLVSPPDETNTLNENQTFNCSITDAKGIANLTLYVWNSTKSNILTNTTNLTGIQNQTSWIYTLPYPGTFEWNCFGYDNSSNSGWSDEGNYTISYAVNVTNCTNITSPGTYLLSQDIPNSPETYCINISTSGVTFDCQGYNIDSAGGGGSYGIYAFSSLGSEYQNLSIENCNVTDWIYGIYWNYVDDSEITNITANSNSDGLTIQNSDGNTLTNITANSNTRWGVYHTYSSFNNINNATLLNNTQWDFRILTSTAASQCDNVLTNVVGTDNKPIVYYNDSVTIEDWNNNVSMIILCDADSSVIDNVTLDHTDKENNGIILVHTDFTNITNVQIQDVYSGFDILYSNVNTFTNITANSNNNGLYLRQWNYQNNFTNIISNENDGAGLYIGYSFNTILTNITANSNSDYGLRLSRSDNITLTNSSIENNGDYGIYLFEPGQTGPSKIYNNFLNNTVNVYFFGTIYNNTWNTTNQSGTRVYSSGPNIGGNYWTDPDGNFSDNCDDDDSDGFCDDAYNVTNGAACTPEVNCSGNADYLAYSDGYVFPIANVVVRTYTNSNYNETDKFYARSETIFTEANVTGSGGENITDATVTANFTTGGSVKNTTVLTKICPTCSIYNGTWVTNSTSTTGVYLVNVTATNAVGSKEDNNSMHLYSGSGVSAYEMDWDADGTNDYVMENKHVISVFNKSAENTNRLLSHVELKDTNVSFTFSDTSDTDSSHRGLIGTDGAKSWYFTDLSFSSTGEGLTTVNLTMNAIDPEKPTGPTEQKTFSSENPETSGQGIIEIIVSVLNDWIYMLQEFFSSITSGHKPKLSSLKTYFSQKENPEFVFEIQEAEEVVESIEVEVYHMGKPVEIKPEVGVSGQGKLSITVPRVRKFKPGLYTLKLTQNGETYETEFLWGVLAINTHKSVYLENEQAFIGIAVLDNEGRMVCDSEVTLEITGPHGTATTLTTSDGTIQVSHQCEFYGVTNLPDYYAYYTVSTEGTYTMKLTAVTRNGIRTMTDTFPVQKQVDFDVERNGPTRIYPPAKYTMTFEIKANKDYDGEIREYVPSSFVITPQQGLAITTSGDTRTLTWNKNLIAGETRQLSYEFDAPDVSPYLFTLGALEIGNWKEARKWMIASDAPGLREVNMTLTEDVDIHKSGGSPSSQHRYVYIEFDISSLPGYSTITYNNATLVLTRSQTADDGGNMDVYRVNDQSCDVTNDAAGTLDGYSINNLTQFVGLGLPSGGQDVLTITGIFNASWLVGDSKLCLRLEDPDKAGNPPGVKNSITATEMNTGENDGSPARFWYAKDGTTPAFLTVRYDDSQNPNASLGTNPSADYSNGGTFTFDLKCSDNDEVNTLQLWGNWSGGWSAKETNSSPANNTFWNVTVSGVAEGSWKWGVYCNDTAGNDDWSDTNRTFTSNLGPKPTNVAATPQKARNTTTVNISATVTDSDGVSVVRAMVDYPNGTFWQNVTMTKTGDVYWNNTVTANFDMPDRYNVTIWANDTGNRINSSETTWFAPYLNLSQEKNITINGSFTDWSGVTVVTDNGTDAGGEATVDNELLLTGLNNDNGNTTIFAFNETGSDTYEQVWSEDDASTSWSWSGGEMGDVNHDGKNDFVISDNEGTTQMEVWSYNASSGEWYEVWRSTSVIENIGDIADFDGDGKNEILVSDGVNEEVEIWGNDTEGATSFSLNATILTDDNCAFFAAGGDMDGDTIPEIVTQCSGEVARIWEWNGTDYENLQNVTLPDGKPGGGPIIDDMECGDVDRDTKDECVLCGNTGMSHVIDYVGGTYVVVYNSTVTPGGAAENPVETCSIGDITNDGWPDWFDAFDDGVRVYSYNGTDYVNIWNYTTSDNAGIGSSGVGDSDNDGYVEFIVFYTTANKYLLFENDTEEASSFNNTLNFSNVATINPSNIIIGDLDTNGSSAGSDPDFDITNVSLANNDSYLFARIGVNGSIDVSGAANYYRVFISTNDSVGNETSPENEDLPFKYDYRVQVNGSECYVFNYTDYGSNVSSCLFNYSGAEMEIGINLSVINLSAGKNANISFQTGSTNPGGYDSAPDGKSFLSYDVPGPAGPTLTLNVTVEMRTEDVDYLVYHWFNFTSGDLGNMWSDVSGRFGSSVGDDRYHVGDGTDQKVEEAAGDQWTNYTTFTNKYIAVYDNSTATDSANNTVLGWVHFENTTNASYEVVSIWNESGKYGSRIRYNLSAITGNDKLAYLLVFSNGTWNTIDQWMSTINSGSYPTTNFMSPPGAVMTALGSFTGPSSIDENESTNYTGNCTCSGGSCDDPWIRIQDNRTGGWSNSSTTGDNVYVNVTSYSVPSPLSGTSDNYYFNVTGNSSGHYNFRVVCNTTSATEDPSPASLLVVSACNVDFAMSSELQVGILFSEQDPSQVNVSAVDNGDYNVTDNSNSGCGTVNVSIRATDDLVNGSSTIGIGNVTVNSTSPDSETIQLSTSYQLIRSGVPAGTTNITTLYFWLTIPSGQDPKDYNTTIYIMEEKE